MPGRFEKKQESGYISAESLRIGQLGEVTSHDDIYQGMIVTKTFSGHLVAVYSPREKHKAFDCTWSDGSYRCIKVRILEPGEKVILWND